MGPIEIPLADPAQASYCSSGVYSVSSSCCYNECSRYYYDFCKLSWYSSYGSVECYSSSDYNWYGISPTASSPTVNDDWYDSTPTRVYTSDSIVSVTNEHIIASMLILLYAMPLVCIIPAFFAMKGKESKLSKYAPPMMNWEVLCIWIFATIFFSWIGYLIVGVVLRFVLSLKEEMHFEFKLVQKQMKELEGVSESASDQGNAGEEERVSDDSLEQATAQVLSAPGHHYYGSEQVHEQEPIRAQTEELQHTQSNRRAVMPEAAHAATTTSLEVSPPTRGAGLSVHSAFTQRGAAISGPNPTTVFDQSLAAQEIQFLQQQQQLFQHYRSLVHQQLLNQVQSVPPASANFSHGFSTPITQQFVSLQPASPSLLQEVSTSAAQQFESAAQTSQTANTNLSEEFSTSAQQFVSAAQTSHTADSQPSQDRQDTFESSEQTFDDPSPAANAPGAS